MPLYEYECGKCHHRFEKIEPVSASATKKCPKCGGQAERLLAAPAFQFKGSGWYATDYAGKKSDSTASSEKSDGKPAAKESATSKENSPAKESSSAKAKDIDGKKSKSES